MDVLTNYWPSLGINHFTPFFKDVCGFAELNPCRFDSFAALQLKSHLHLWGRGANSFATLVIVTMLISVLDSSCRWTQSKNWRRGLHELVRSGQVTTGHLFGIVISILVSPTHQRVEILFPGQIDADEVFILDTTNKIIPKRRNVKTLIFFPGQSCDH